MYIFIFSSEKFIIQCLFKERKTKISFHTLYVQLQPLHMVLQMNYNYAYDKECKESSVPIP